LKDSDFEFRASDFMTAKVKQFKFGLNLDILPIYQF